MMQCCLPSAIAYQASPLLAHIQKNKASVTAVSIRALAQGVIYTLPQLGFTSVQALLGLQPAK
jgi:hypothetical protein